MNLGAVWANEWNEWEILKGIENIKRHRAWIGSYQMLCYQLELSRTIPFPGEGSNWSRRGQKLSVISKMISQSMMSMWCPCDQYAKCCLHILHCEAVWCSLRLHFLKQTQQCPASCLTLRIYRNDLRLQAFTVRLHKVCRAACQKFCSHRRSFQSHCISVTTKTYPDLLSLQNTFSYYSQYFSWPSITPDVYTKIRPED